MTTTTLRRGDRAAAAPRTDVRADADEPTWERVAPTDAFASEGPHAASARGVDLVILRGKTGLRAYEARCPHQGALLSEGEIEGDTLVCRNHRWRFDVDSGRRVGGAACLRSCPVRVHDGVVEVDARALRERAEETPERSTPLLRVEDLPGPPALPLLGNFLELDIDRLHVVLERWGREYGPRYVVRMGPKPMLVLSDLTLIQEILRERPDTYRRISNVETVFDELAVSGVFSAEGGSWRPQRKLAMEALSHRHLRTFYPTLREVGQRLFRRWRLAAESGRVLDLCAELQRFTVDVTTTLVFGRDINTLERGDDDVIQQHLAHVFPGLNRRLNALLPYWRYFRLPEDRSLERALVSIRDWLGAVIHETKDDLAAHPERAASPRNFMEAMLLARDDAGEPFSEKVIFGNALTMLLAGEDTTSNTLAWAVHELLEAPRDVTARLAAESDQVLGTDRVPADIDAASRLAFAGAVANETMRLRPVAPLFFIEPNHDTVLGDFALPKGAGILLLMRPPAVDGEHFADPQAFRPARWVDAHDGAHDASSHLPFGSGPRICPGRSLALLEMKLVLGLLYRSFDVTRVGAADDVKERFSFTMMPENLRVRLRLRH